jgi:hypothetical protein
MFRNLYVAMAMALGAGASGAATFNHGPFTASVSGLDPYFKSAVLNGSTTRFLFELTDSVQIPEVVIKFDLDDAQLDGTYAWGTYRISFTSFDGYLPGGIAFSYSTIKWDWGISPVDHTDLTLAETRWNSFASIPTEGTTVTITDFLFGAGQGLNPSTDSSCGSFSCMRPYTTKGLFTVDLTIPAVPESGTLPSALAGLAVIGLITKCRRRI